MSRFFYTSDKTAIVDDKYFELDDIENNVTVIIVIEVELDLEKDILEAYIEDKRYTKIMQFLRKQKDKIK